LKRYSAKLSYAFMLSILFLATEVLITVVLVKPLHGLLENLGYLAENYISGMVSAIISCAVGLICYRIAKDKFLVPYSFALILVYTIVVIILCIAKQECGMIWSLVMPTLGLLSVLGNLLFWGIFYARLRKTKRNETV